MFRTGYDTWRKHRKKVISLGAISGGLFLYNNIDEVQSVVDTSCMWMWERLPSVLKQPTTTLWRTLFTSHDNAPAAPQHAPCHSAGCEDQSTSTTPDNHQNQEQCPGVTLTLHQTTAEIIRDKASPLIGRLLNVTDLRRQCALHSGGEAEIWSEIAVTSWSRCLASVYVLVHVTVFLQIQSNIAAVFLAEQLAGRSLPAAVALLPTFLDSHHQYAFSEGIEDLIHQVRNVVKKLLTTISLDSQLSAKNVRLLVARMRHLIEGNPAVDCNGNQLDSYFVQFMVPSSCGDAGIEQQVYDDESKILVDLNHRSLAAVKSVDSRLLVSICLDQSFTRICHELEELIEERCGRTGGECTDTVVSLPHAALLPALVRISTDVLENSTLFILQSLLEIPYFESFRTRMQRRKL